MKKYLLLVLLILWPSIASAALNGVTNWELRGNGNDTNGGGFALGVSTNLSKTDLVVDATNNTQVTSATYVFTSADIGRWIQVTAGTNWRTGYYHVLSVSGVKATLNLSPAAVGTTAGSFTAYWGLDYSQQNAKNANGGSNGSSVLTVGNGTTTITCSDCSFTHDVIGNVAYLSGGTGSISPQRRAITGWTNATTITIDTAIASSTGMTINIGGALASMDETLSARGIVAGNVIWWKNDTGITTGNALSSSVGGRINGYNATRGDMDASIGSASRPTLTFTGTGNFAMTLTSGSWDLRDFVVNASSGTGANGISVAGTVNYLYNVTAKNYDGTSISLGTSTSISCYACEATGGTVNATKGISVVNGGEVWDSYVHDGNGVGISASSAATIVGNIVANQAGASSDCIQFTSTTNAPPVILNNVGYNCGRHGIGITTTVTTLPHVIGNLMVNNAGWGISFPAAKAADPYYDGNAFYNNTLGTRNNMDALTQGAANPAYVNVNDITLSGNPFVSAGTGNFALNATAGAGGALRNAGLPRTWPGTITAGYPDLGAAFHQDPGTITVNANCAY